MEEVGAQTYHAPRARAILEFQAWDDGTAAIPFLRLLRDADDDGGGLARLVIF